ncbi:MAG TPA: ABC transporter substrate-binding protein [Dehalococcoidia bacterium]|nr:ABC transporter substrate-binding protein [Dehalococcoidia bacterium]
MIRTGRWPLLTVFAIGLIALASVWLTGIDSGNAPVGATGGTYVEAVVGSADRANPLFASSPVERDLVKLLFAGLTRPGADGSILPDLAESWSVSEDGRRYTFQLRPRLQWHDGEPITADDVVFTASLLSSPDYAGDPTIAALWRNVDARRIDRLTVEFELEQPFAPFLAATTIGLLPSHLLGDLSVQEVQASSFNQAPIGSGPFVLDSIGDDGARLRANRSYHLQPPYLDRLGLRFFETAEEAQLALQAGQVDGMLLPDRQAAEALSGDDFTIVKMPTSAYVVLYLNHRSVLFVDSRVRQALALSIDREAIVADVLAGDGIASADPLAPGTWASTEEGGELEVDPDRAAELMEEAGWQLQDGTWRRGDIEMRFNILTNPDAERLAVAEAVARQLRDVGFLASVAEVDPNTLVQDFLQPRQYQAALFAFDPGIDPDPYPAWHSSQSGSGGANLASYVDEEADRLLAEARIATSEEARRQLYAALVARFREQAPSVILYYPERLYAVRDDVRGVAPGAFFDRTSRFFAIEDWYRETRSP